MIQLEERLAERSLKVLKKELSMGLTQEEFIELKLLIKRIKS
ncbi:hypothetical protein ACFSCX_19325 [Bacillus salitolerans]|uniref:Fur-regulated basic protein FbpA n=1 Tax=Bacillus salitolerans TaxID=1437434 RepID=A0ABW4LU40_9BACI